MKKVKAITIITVLGFLMIQCAGPTNSGDKDQSSNESEMEQDTKPDDPLIKSYLAIKNALVESDTKTAMAAADEMSRVLRETGTDNEKLQIYARGIVKTDSLNVQREQFNLLSTEFYEYIKNNTGDHGKLYRQYCPMAFSGEGAYWLSDEKEIFNPYFGDMMLHCGTVKEEL